MQLASRLSSRLVSYGFCIFKAHLDPSKHITMSHSPHNMFIDEYDIGQYPVIPDCGSLPARTYEPQVFAILLLHLNAKFRGNVTAEQLLQIKDQDFNRVLKKLWKTSQRFQQLIPGILNKLAFEIVVKESKWTWVIEQKRRLQFSQYHVASSIKPKSLSQFLSAYNQTVQILNLQSSMGYSPKIPHPKTALQKHFEQQMIESVAITDPDHLEEMTKDNSNMINRFLRWIHTP